MPAKQWIRSFFFPRLTAAFLLRVLIVVAVAFLTFRFVLRPMWIRGKSMEPTYQDGSFVFCFCLYPLFREPEVGDVVAIRMAGPDIMLLKRVLALEDDTVAFVDGTLYVNGEVRREPYVVYRSGWNKDPVRVKDGYVYVVGDNRALPPYRHRHGQASVDRIVGVPLW